MNLNDIRDNEGARSKFKRRGRGLGSGKGKTAGRGTKGQKSRSGVAINGFEGGQMSIFMRLGKRGFKSMSRKNVKTVSLEFIQKAIDEHKLDVSEKITSQHIKNLIKIPSSKALIKLLAKGELKSPIDMDIDLYSMKAQEAILAVGGKLNSPIIA